MWEFKKAAFIWEHESCRQPGLQGEGHSRIREDEDPWGGTPL